jgi:hypothetical protein
MKRLFTVLLTLCLAVLFATCENQNQAQEAMPNIPEQNMAQSISEQDMPPDMPEQDIPWKVAIYTYEHDYRHSILGCPNDCLEGRALERYPEHVLVGTCLKTTWPPEKYEKELVEKGVALIQDEQVKVFIAYANSEELLKEIKEQRPDILLITFGGDDNLYETSLSDIIFVIDKMTMSEKMVRQAFDMGANTFIYYSFRYYSPNVKLGEFSLSFFDRYCAPILEDTCTKLGMEYILEIVPRSSEYMSGIHSDLREKISQYGKNISYYIEICPISMSLYQTTKSFGIIMPQPCHPSILHGFPGWYWGSNSEEHRNLSEFDFDKQIERAREKATEMGVTGRFACWRVPYDTLALTAAIEYSIDYVNNGLQANIDLPTMEGYFQRALESLGAADTALELTQHPDYPNCFMFTEDYILL